MPTLLNRYDSYVTYCATLGIRPADCATWRRTVEDIPDRSL